MDKTNGVELPDEIMNTISGGAPFPESMDQFIWIAQQLQAAGYTKDFIKSLVDPSTPNYNDYIDFVETKWYNWLRP